MEFYALLTKGPGGVPLYFSLFGLVEDHEDALSFPDEKQTTDWFAFLTPEVKTLTWFVAQVELVNGEKPVLIVHIIKKLG